MRNKRLGAFMLAKRFPGLLLLAEVLFLCLAAAPSLTAETANTGIDARRLSEYIRILASDDFEGRGPGTRGEDKTLAYLTDQDRKSVV